MCAERRKASKAVFAFVLLATFALPLTGDAEKRLIWDKVGKCAKGGRADTIILVSGLML